MDIAVALDQPRRRDLRFYTADDDTVNVTVYEVDGDFEPIEVTDVEMTYGLNEGTLFAGESFTVGFDQRTTYVIRGVVDGRSTTLAYGLLIRPWDSELYVSTYVDGDAIFTLQYPFDDGVFDGGTA